MWDSIRAGLIHGAAFRGLCASGSLRPISEQNKGLTYCVSFSNSHPVKQLSFEYVYHIQSITLRSLLEP